MASSLLNTGELSRLENVLTYTTDTSHTIPGVST